MSTNEMGRHSILVAVACCLSCACALPQVKTVKGGGGGGYNPYNATANLIRFYGNDTTKYSNSNTTQHAHNNSQTYHIDFEKGVCYTEVPTVNLVKTSGHIPAGNGSRPDLSRIRTCCNGYVRNIYNFKICDPVCREECINSLCSAPDTCSCFPDHVKNLSGVCVPTCPIGCQHGTCSGGECMCKEGYQLDADSKFCYPKCKDNCGGLGNCTAPNKCECNKGYESSSDGTCRPHCEHCNNGDCVSTNVCRCHQGFTLNSQGDCQPQCPRGCGPSGRCTGPNQCTCSEGLEFDQNSRQCRPKCTKPCGPNGECAAPNECRCNTGYSKNERGECTPSCPQGCGSNGICTAPNVCTCPHGHDMDELSHQCRPRCNACHHGDCVGPNQCKCHQGYSKSDYGECIPVCQQGCGNQGQCVAPNICVCPPGLVFDINTHQCQGGNYQGNNYQGSNHQGGSYQGSVYQGTTSQGSSFESANQQGSTYQGGNYQQQSNPTGCTECYNGVCEENVCICNSGYINDRNDPSGNRCISHCPGGCPNGICSAPNFCICNMGYIKDRSVKGRPACVKRARRSIDPEEAKKPINLAELLIFDLPNDY